MFSHDFKIEMLMKAVKIYSPTGHERELSIFLKNFLKHYCNDVFIDDVGNIIAIRGRGDPTLWLHAHMDTVPGYLEVKLSNGKLYGRGACDDKASLLAMAFAFLEVEEVRGTLMYVGVVDEEGDSLGTRYLIENAGRSIPKPNAIIIGEPTGLDKIVTTYRGGFVVKIKVKSRGGHASSPTTTINPIVRVYEIYDKLCRLLSVGNVYDSINITPTVIRGGDFENKIPTMCEMILNIRIPPKTNCLEVLKKLNGFIEELSIDNSISVTYSRCIEPINLRIDNPIARAVTRAIIKKLNIKPLPARKWGSCDMNELVVLTKDMVAYGPGEGEYAHSDEEHVSIDDYLKAIEVYKEAVKEYYIIVEKRSR